MSLRYFFIPFGVLIYIGYIIGILLMPFAMLLGIMGFQISTTNMMISLIIAIISLILILVLIKIPITTSNLSKSADFVSREVHIKVNNIRKFRKENIKVDSVDDLKNPNLYQLALISLYLPIFALLIEPKLVLPALFPFVYHIFQIITIQSTDDATMTDKK